MLTSKHVTAFPNLAGWYLDDERFEQPTHFLQLSVQADDMFTAHEEELLVLTDEGVVIDYIPQLVESHATSNPKRIPSKDPDWIENEGAPEIGPSPAHWVPVPA